MNDSSTPSPSRGMASIAHFFLSRQSRERISPEDTLKGVRSATGESISAESNVSIEETACSCCAGLPLQREMREESLLAKDDRFLPTAIALIADHLSDSRNHLETYARQLSFHNGPASLICLQDTQAEWYNFNHENIPDSKLNADEVSFGLLEKEEVRLLLGETDSEGNSSTFSIQKQGSILSELAGRSETLLVSPAHRQLRGMREILSLSKTAVVFCRSDSEGLIDAYQAVKWLVTEMDYTGDISLFVCDGREDTIDEVHGRLAETAQKFLCIDIPFAEYPQLCEVPMSQQDLPPDLSMDMTSHLINLLQAELNPNSNRADDSQEKPISEASKPTDTLENQSLYTSGPEIPPVCSSETHTPETEIPSQDTISSQPSSVFPIPLRPIVVENFPRSAGQVTELLQMRVPMWLRQTGPALTLPLYLPKPFDSAFRVLLDSQGRAYLLAVNLTGDPGYFSAALQGRQWVKDNLIQHMRQFRQLHLAPGEDPGLILVISDSNLWNQAKQHAATISQFPCHILQLHFLQTEFENFILLV